MQSIELSTGMRVLFWTSDGLFAGEIRYVQTASVIVFAELVPKDPGEERSTVRGFVSVPKDRVLAEIPSVED
jgi:hypothetical protein